MNRPKLLYIVNDAPFFLSHRMPLALAARAAGYRVAVACPQHPSVAKLQESGLEYFELPLPRNRGRAVRELGAVLRLWSIAVGFKPDLAHLITAKPIIIGGVVCRVLGVPVLAAVSGLGHVFIGQDWKSRALRAFALGGYRIALKRRRALAIFQNPENLAIFEAAHIVDDRFVMIRGSGANLADFDPTPPSNPVHTVILPARMLWTKGVGEFVEAARIVHRRGMQVRFILAGGTDLGNPASIDEAQLSAWSAEGEVEWIGYQTDIAQALQQADIVVLPSYSEGLPKSLVDASAAGRPIVTTDVPGCRDAIVPGETGLLCAARDPADLAAKIKILLDDPVRRLAMGRAARAYAESEFDIEKITAQHLDCYARLLPSRLGTVA